MVVVKLWLHKKVVIENIVLKRNMLTFVSRYLKKNVTIYNSFQRNLL